MEISVIIPVYNASEFLEKAVNSALQHTEVKEIVLIEDKSTDNSLEICKKLANNTAKIKLYQHHDKENHGAGATRNLGLEKAHCSYITFLDADDYYLPNRFEAEKELFKDPKTDGIFGAVGVDYLSEKGRQEFENKFNSTGLTTVNFAAEGEDVFKGLLGLTPRIFGTFFSLNALTVRKSAITNMNLRFNRDLRVHQDSDFIIKLAYYCHLKTGIINKAVAVRGVHDNNRITKIVKYSKKYNQCQFLLWNSLYKWSKTVGLPSEAKELISLQNKAFELANKKGLQKKIGFLMAIFSNPKILKTKYRFTFTNNAAQ